MKWLALFAAAYLAAAALCRPAGVTIIDEVSYFAEADAIAHGRDLRRPESFLPATFEPVFAGPRYPIGWPLLLAPLTRLPWPAPFALPVALHLLATFLFARLLQRRGAPAFAAVFFLAQPTLALFSRTLMAEPLAELQLVGMLWAAELGSALGLGALAGLAAFIKLSQAPVALLYGVTWALSRPRPERLSAIGRLALGGLPTLAVSCGSLLFFAVGPHLPGGFGFAPWGEAARFLLDGLALLVFTLPVGLLLGALRARREERVTALGVTLLLAVYSGFHYRGPTLAATLLVGSRLHAPVYLLLLPGYAELFGKLSRPWRQAAGSLAAASALAVPWLLFGALAARRAELGLARSAAIATLRPGCRAGYSPFAAKLLVPFPPELGLVSAQSPAPLAEALARGECVDLIDPPREPSTNLGAPATDEAFGALKQGRPHCALDLPQGARVVRLGPASCGPSGDLGRPGR